MTTQEQQMATDLANEVYTYMVECSKTKGFELNESTFDIQSGLKGYFDQQHRTILFAGEQVKAKMEASNYDLQIALSL